MNANGKPTLEQFEKYQAAYDYFNRELFGGELEPCLLVFREGPKKKNVICFGHFCANRWSKGADTCHEISLNPDTLARPLAETMSTLVHEMVHQWQQDYGKAPRTCYHDRQFAAKMEEVGLIPSDTGAEGGKKVGQRMSHYVAEGGPFAEAMASMPDAIRLPWATGGGLEADKAKPEKEKQRNKIKYTCPGCEANCWGKPGLNVICGECSQTFEEVDPE